MPDRQESPHRVIPVVVVGARGRMGKALIHEVVASNDLSLVGAVDRTAGPGIGQDAGELAGTTHIDVRVSDEFAARRGTVVVDFSLAEATRANIERCLVHGAALVLGTSGIDQETREFIQEASREIAIVHATNCSVGVTLLHHLVSQAVKALDSSWDSEIIELHHRYKKDAPSGTAARLAENIATARGNAQATQIVTARTGEHRHDGEIGVVSLRGGDSVGEHSVYFLGDGERIELTHRAHERAIFARGALRAARWVANKPPGLYSMNDVLGLG